jgi:hypothetical protein
VAKDGKLQIPGSPPSWGFYVPLATALSKTFLLTCSTVVEQVETQLRVVVPIEEEEEEECNYSIRFPYVCSGWLLEGP